MHHRILPRNNFLILLIALISSLFLFAGCWKYPYPPTTSTPPILPTYLTKIVVLPATMELEVGESQSIISITAYYSNSSTTNIPLSNCFYYSYNPSCATVNSSELITGISAGTTIILVTYTEGTISKTDTMEVTVTQNEIIYRALCVGVGDYIYYDGEDDLLAPPFDVDRVRQTLSYCKFGLSNTGFFTISYLKNW